MVAFYITSNIEFSENVSVPLCQTEVGPGVLCRMCWQMQAANHLSWELRLDSEGEVWNLWLYSMPMVRFVSAQMHKCTFATQKNLMHVILKYIKELGF